MKNWKGPIKKKGKFQIHWRAEIETALEIVVGFKIGYKRRNSLWLKLKQEKGKHQNFAAGTWKVND